MCHPSCLQAQCLKGSGEVSKENHPFCEEVDKEHLTLDILKKSYYTSDRGLLYCVPLGVKILAGKKVFMYVPNNGENNSLAQKYDITISLKRIPETVHILFFKEKKDIKLLLKYI